MYLELLAGCPEAGDRQDMADLAALETPEGGDPRRGQAFFINKIYLLYINISNFHSLIKCTVNYSKLNAVKHPDK